MKIITTVSRMSAQASAFKKKGLRVGFVPTMGALHEGHLSLIRQARRDNDIVVVSIFVNPTQFGPGEDLKKYPRDMQKDAAVCKNNGVDIIFHPGAKEMYPEGFTTCITVEGLSRRLCGKFRPGHFKGVATVVAKLFNIVMPDNAYFGQKDAQQSVIIRRMVKDLNMQVRVSVLPTVRQPGGLALSSRNKYLSGSEEERALVLKAALDKAGVLVKKGAVDTKKIINAIRPVVRRGAPSKIDYIEIVDPCSLMPVRKIKDEALLAMAVWIGKTRLIDNRILKS